MKIKILLCLVLATVGQSIFAQTQQGYVKTKGRMVNGKHIPGQGIKGATVTVLGSNSVLVNTDDGAFSFPVPSKNYQLKEVKKNGYQLVDADIIRRSYTYSIMPLYIVMETPEQQLQDQLESERKIRRTLAKQLQQREDELESLKEQQKISEEEYQKALQELYEKTDQNEQLVKDMVERYSKIDYDQLSEFDQQISDYILNGDLIKADSLLNTKGNIYERVTQYRKLEATNAKEREELSQREKQLEQSQALALQERDDLANDCYRKFEIFKMRHQYDSAGYFIELSVNLDTTNIKRNFDAGSFFGAKFADYEKALFYYNRTLRLSELQSYDKQYWAALCYIDMADYVFNPQGYYDTALELLEKGLNLYTSYCDGIMDEKNDPYYGMILYNLGKNYREKKQYDKALKYSDDALNSGLSQDSTWLEIIYLEKGRTHDALKEYDKALSEFEKCLEICKSIYGENSERESTVCIFAGFSCINHGDYDKAIGYAKQANTIRKAIYGEDSPKAIKSQKWVDQLTYMTITKKNTDITDFITDHCFTATIVEGDTPASQQGMSGEYILLEFADWNQDSPSSLFDKNKELQGKPKYILVMKDGTIEQHYFENTIGVKLKVRYVGIEERQRINKAYEEWIRQNRQ